VPEQQDERQSFLLRIKDEEVRLIKKTCKYKGIENQVINPKAISIHSLMGGFDFNQDWKDGVFT
jgi:hypothetical protein